MALPLLRPHYRGVAADLILDGRTDVEPRRIRLPRRWLAAVILVAAALFLLDRWLQQREFDQLTDRVATAQTSIDYAEQRVTGMIQYGSPQLFIARTPAGVQTYLRGLVSDASTQGANDIAAAQTAVAGVSILPWHRNLVAARTAFLNHAQTWQDFLRSSLPDRDPNRAERLQPGHLGALVVGAQVQVEPVLDRLSLGHTEEEQVRCNTVASAASGRLEHHLVGILVGPPPPQGGLPEGGGAGGIHRVDGQGLDANAHSARLFRMPPDLSITFCSNSQD